MNCFHRSASLDVPPDLKKDSKTTRSKNRDIKPIDQKPSHISGHTKEVHKTNQTKLEEFESFADRFNSLEDVTREIKAKGLDECGLIIGTLLTH